MKEPSKEEHIDIDALRREISEADAADVVANHCYGLFELAAIHLSQAPPRLSQATLAIDALGAIVERCEGRLGQAEAELKEALNQLRLAFVQVSVLGDPPSDGEAAH